MPLLCCRHESGYKYTSTIFLPTSELSLRRTQTFKKKNRENREQSHARMSSAEVHPVFAASKNRENLMQHIIGFLAKQSEAGFFFWAGCYPIGIDGVAGGLDWKLASESKPTDKTSET